MRPEGTIALLPLKGHSERVPGKNFRRLGERPLFVWMLDTLLAIPTISHIVINTDASGVLFKDGLRQSERILVRDRKPELCGDLISMNRIIEDDITAVPGDAYLMTHVTNPFLRAPTILRALEAYRRGLERGDVDSLFAVTRSQARFYRKDGSAVNHDPNNLIRTQDLEPWFEENSCLYIFSRESFSKTKARIGERPMLFETPKLESVDIDDPDDWALAEALANAPCGLQSKHRRCP
ncbi:MAG: cytidylyltransferase domain-containing protein [Gammaproteobacteria bacterium]